jgi:hypothetical protein
MPEWAALIATLIVDRPLCLPCVAGRAQIPELEAKGYLDRLRAHLTIYREGNDRCRACGIVGKVHSLSRLPL